MHIKIISKTLVLLLFLMFCFPFCSLADILSDQQQIETLIESGKLTDAQTKIEKLKTDYPQDANLPKSLYLIARRYGWSEKYEQEKNLYQMLIQTYPETIYASKAELGCTRADVLKLIITGKYDEAEAAIDKLTVDFAAHPDLMDTFYWIAERYRWAHRWDDAQYYYQQVIENCTDQQQVERAKLGLAKVEVLALIVAKNFGPAEQALDELIANYSANPDLPETLYRIARGYEWTAKYEKAKEIHELIVSQFADSEFAERSKLGIERNLASILITSGKSEDANSVVAAIKANFKENPDYTDTLYEIARVYDYVGSIEQAAAMHGSIAADFPDDKFSSKASLEDEKLKAIGFIETGMYEDANLTVTGIKANFADNEKYYEALEEIAEQYDRAGQFPRAVVIYRQIVENCRGDEICALAQANLDKYELFAAVDTGDNELIEQTVSGLGKSFTNQPDRLDDYLNTLAKKCYSEAQWSVIEDNKERAAPYYRAALRMRERVFNECPNSPLAPVACFCAAVIAQQELGDYAQGIEYFQKTADDWPGYEHSPWALVKVASTLELAGRDGLLDADGARLAAIAVLKSVIDKYPQDEMAKYAQERLDYYNKDESEQDPEQPATCGSNKEGEL